MIASSAIVLAASAAIVSASPLQGRQATGDNGSCAALQQLCVNQVDAQVKNPWAVEACVLGATCFGGQHQVDDFLASVASKKGVPFIGSRSSPRVSDSVFAAIAKNDGSVSQQDFIDAYFHTLDQSGGPYPSSVGPVISYYQRVQTWTAFCNKDVPKMNFLDYYQYSATVNSNGCGGSVSTSSVASASSTSVASATSVTASASSIGSTTVSSSASPTSTIQPVSGDASCNALFNLCYNKVDSKVTNPWSIQDCVLASTCFGGKRPVDNFLAFIYTSKGNGDSSTYKGSRNVPRVSDNVFAFISKNDGSVTQQDFIDAYYHTLDQSNGPYPSNVATVINYFNRVTSWTSYCQKPIPKKNFIDYFQYSATVQGTGCTQ